jgi:hypothetical protein
MAKLHLVRSSDDPVLSIRHTGGARGAIQYARSALRVELALHGCVRAEAARSTPPMEADEVRSLAAELAVVARSFGS